MPDFLDFIRGGSGSQGAPVAGDLPSDGARPSDIRSIFSLLSDTTQNVAGVVNSFRGVNNRPNVQTPAVPLAPSAGPGRFLPIALLVVGGLALWWFLKRK